MLTCKRKALGNINPARFVSQVCNDGKCVHQSKSANDVFGISRTSPKDLVGGCAATNGETLDVNRGAGPIMLELGGTVKEGELLKSDDRGRGVKAKKGERESAKAMASGVAGQLIPVRLA